MSIAARMSSDACAHLRVLPGPSLSDHGDTGEVMASAVGTGLPEAAPVRAGAPTSGTVSTTGCVRVL